MTDRCDVAVIGGGVIGLAAACYLTDAGAGRVVVLERLEAVGQESSARANGGIRAQFTTPVNIAFSLFSIDAMEQLQVDSGGLPSFHQTGYLLLTGTEEGEVGLRAAMELQHSLGVQTEWLGPEEIVARVPLVGRDGLRAGTFHQRDGFLDPHGVVAALRRLAGTRGAEVLLGREVQAVRSGPGEGFTLRTSRGDLASDWVVNAAGSHARSVGEMLDVEVPVDPVRRNLAYARDPDAEPGLIPMCVDLDTGVLMRREVGGGYVIAFSNPADPVGWDVSLDPEFLEQLAGRIGHRFPRLEDIPIDPRRCWAGLYPETEDHHAIVGPTPGMEGFTQCAGFGGHGIMHSPAAGKAVAEMITEGRCRTFDLRPLRLERFAEGDLVVETAVL